MADKNLIELNAQPLNSLLREPENAAAAGRWKPFGFLGVRKMSKYLNLKETLAFRHRSRSSHFRDIKEGLCPRGINVGPRSTVWLKSELVHLRCAIIAGQTWAEIRQLVSEMHAKRISQFVEFEEEK